VARPDRYWLRGLTLPLGLYVLVSIAVAGGTFGLLFFVMLGTLALSVTLFYRLFPGNHFTTIALANFLSIYACLSTFFTESNFSTAADWAVRLSFVLPIAAYITGVWLRREAIHQLVRHEEGSRIHYAPRRFIWLIPVFAVGIASFLLPHRDFDAQVISILLVVSMGLIGVWLIIFGFSEVLRYARERDWRDQRRHGRH
jgi:hypothetical protein